MEERCSPSFLQGHPPSLRFGHPDVTTDDTAPPHARTRLERGVAIPSGSDIRVPSRVLSAAKQGEGGAPERVGSPAGAEERYSVPTDTVLHSHMRLGKAPSQAKRVS